MITLVERMNSIISQYHCLMNDVEETRRRAMPENTFVLDKDRILALPRKFGDSRYPYGKDGFIFWAHSSGYMYGNEGLFSVFLRAAEGEEPRIAFFAGIPDSRGAYQPFSLLGVPRLPEPGESSIKRYTVFSTSYIYYITETPELNFIQRVFVTESKEIVFTLEVENLTDSPQRFFLSSYFNPFLRHQLYESSEDRWFRDVRLISPQDSAQALSAFLVSVNQDYRRDFSLTHYGILRRGLYLDTGSSLEKYEETTSRYQYVDGITGNLQTARCLWSGSFLTQEAKQTKPVCGFSEIAVAADLIHLSLAPHSTACLTQVFQWTDDRKQAMQVMNQPVDLEHLEQALLRLNQNDHKRHQTLSVKVETREEAPFTAEVFHTFWEYLKRQVEFCSIHKGYLQVVENALIGIRDVFQSLEGLLYWQPEAARQKMLEALNYMTPEGRCFRQYSLPLPSGEPGRMDLRAFIDQGVWVISTIATYLRVTGDLTFLHESCGYHEILNQASGKVRRLDMTDPVVEHLIRIMDYLLSQRDLAQTGCVYALYGDWNDALDGMGISRQPGREFGTGVSVMATLQTFQNTAEMVEILTTFDSEKYHEKINAYRQAREELKEALKRNAIVENEQGEKRILHGWGDQRHYLVGSFKDPDGACRDGLTSNAFWVLSGMDAEDTSLRPVILAAFKRLSSKYGLKTFEPLFPKGAPGVGRISNLPPGTAENAASYVHASLFGAMALFAMGYAREAWEELVRLLPFTSVHQTLSHSPFVIPNSYCLNEDILLDGQSMNDWQTGSANVLLKMMIRYVFGVNALQEGLWIQPSLASPFRRFMVALPIRAHRFVIHYESTPKVKQRTFHVNNKQTTGVWDEQMQIQRLWIPYADLLTETIEIRVEDPA